MNHGGAGFELFCGLCLTLWQLILADDPAESRGLRLWSERRRSKLSITSLSELLGAKPFPRLSAERVRQMTAAKHCAPPTERRTVRGERACPLKSRCALARQLIVTSHPRSLWRMLAHWCLRLYGDSGLHLAGECLVASDPRIAHGGSELGAEGLLQRPEQCSGNRVIVRRLDPISRVAPPEIAHSRVGEVLYAVPRPGH